jgi:repressor LexA
MKKFEKLSERQQKILKFMDRYVNMHGYPPTIREIGEATQINSTSVVNYNLNKLVKLGYIQRSSTKSRGLRMVKNVPGGGRTVRASNAAMTIPLMGRIVAGQPVEQFDSSDEDIEVVPTMLGGVDPSEVFAVRVNGDSMIDAMIRDGDIVILRSMAGRPQRDHAQVHLLRR